MPKYQPGSKAGSGAFRKGVVQAKLMVNEPGDKYEKEADAMAAQVMQKKEKEPAGGMIARSLKARQIGRAHV